MHAWRHTLFVYFRAFGSSHSQAFFSPLGKNIFAKFQHVLQKCITEKDVSYAGLQDFT